MAACKHSWKAIVVQNAPLWECSRCKTIRKQLPDEASQK